VAGQGGLYVGVVGGREVPAGGRGDTLWGYAHHHLLSNDSRCVVPQASGLLHLGFTHVFPGRRHTNTNHVFRLVKHVLYRNHVCIQD